MKETLKNLRESLVPKYGKGETEAIIRIIFHYLKGWSLTDILIHGDEELSPYIKSEIKKIQERLLQNEPIQYITGEARFHGMTFQVNPGVLIPRPETDELVDIIIKDYAGKEDLKVLDLCTGSGCIAISLARNLKFPKITALDTSSLALQCANKNASALKVSINFIQADIFKWQPDSKYDIIVSNPPYVDDSERISMPANVVDFEPSEAIFVRDDNPLVFYKRIADIAQASLNKTGTLYLEINPRHSEELKGLMKAKGMTDIEIIKDSFGKDRFMVCRKGN